MAPMSLCKDEGNTHTHTCKAQKINKIRLTAESRLRAHEKEDEDRRSRGLKTQAWGRERGREREVTLYSRARSAAGESVLS